MLKPLWSTPTPPLSRLRIARRTPKKVRRFLKRAYPLPLLQATRLQTLRTCRLKVWEVTLDTVPTLFGWNLRRVHQPTLIPPLSPLLRQPLLSLRIPFKPQIIIIKNLTCLLPTTQLFLLLWHHHLYLLHPAQ